LQIEYESFGDETAPAILLIMGLAAQLIHWPLNLCEDLSQRGYRVIRFDNRDVGLSSKLDHLGEPNILWLTLGKMIGLNPKVPYNLQDMARDVVGLMDALGITTAHLAGVSLGGIIAQLVAIDYPQRILSLTSIMSTTGNKALPKPDSKILRALATPPKDIKDKQSLVEQTVFNMKLLMSPKYALGDELLEQAARLAVERNYDFGGRLRQLAASTTGGDRREALNKLQIPVTVLHGSIDPLLPVACAHDTAANVKDADLRIVEGMSHEFPPALMPQFADAIESSIKRSQA